jgi:hypothetical protein
MSFSQHDLSLMRHELVRDYLEKEGLSVCDIEVLCHLFGLHYRANLAQMYRRSSFEAIATHISQDPACCAITRNSIRIFQMICHENYVMFKEILPPMGAAAPYASRASYLIDVNSESNSRV